MQAHRNPKIKATSRYYSAVEFCSTAADHMAQMNGVLTGNERNLALLPQPGDGAPSPVRVRRRNAAEKFRPKTQKISFRKKGKK